MKVLTKEEIDKKQYISLKFYLIYNDEKELSFVVDTPFLSFLLKNGAVLVKVSKIGKINTLVWYFPRDRINKIQHGIPVNSILTYKKSEGLGFKWVEDIIFRQNKSIFDIVHWLSEYIGYNEYALGNPRRSKGFTYGVYENRKMNNLDEKIK